MTKLVQIEFGHWRQSRSTKSEPTIPDKVGKSGKAGESGKAGKHVKYDKRVKVGSDEDNEDAPLLHGNLKIEIIEARDLPDTDNCCCDIVKGDLTDPYVKVKLGKLTILKTGIRENDLNPVWREKFNVPVCHYVKYIRIKVKDRELLGANTVGFFDFPTEKVLTGEPIEGWYELLLGRRGTRGKKGELHVKIQFFEIEYAGKELNDAYFPSKPGNKVTLYQDAMTPQLPVFDTIVNPDGTPYKTTNCWSDLFHAINNAQKVIYITGWSVYTGIGLLRGDDTIGNDDSNVGELLKKKAEQGVRVLMMVWNDKSNDLGLHAGMLGTHDEETDEYFRDTKVICVNAHRTQESFLGLGACFVSALYTHHQKTVIVDAAKPDGSPERRLVAFVGGLDITDGRYDTPEFPLYKTIHTLHHGDFYSKCVSGVTQEWGPREPWHDIHSLLEGPVAMDVCQNFIERWSKQAGAYEGQLLDMSEGFDLDYEVEPDKSEGGPWEVQILRSITSDSAVFDGERLNVLHRKYGRLVDNSILKAYINLIRNASNYVYIENQYFLGSAFAWIRERAARTNHILPSELAHKIVKKIKAGEQFKAYVTIPMYPEGFPDSMPSQEILYWQFNTIESMYKTIAKAIKKAGKEDIAHPQDYLNFFCLGKREGPEEIPDDMLVPDDPECESAKVRKSIRHPIYVHSKLMIVDDDYIVIGSANINQRSLGGNRDTEICMGAFQPDHTILNSRNKPRGAIHTFRTALWAAHCGGGDPAFDDPASDECLAKVKQVSSDFWRHYTAPEPAHSDCHLLPYPVVVAETGDLSPLEPPWDIFPDTCAKVRGTKSSCLPSKLTT